MSEDQIVTLINLIIIIQAQLEELNKKMDKMIDMKIWF